MMVSDISDSALLAQLLTVVLHLHITLSHTPIRAARSPLTDSE